MEENTNIDSEEEKQPKGKKNHKSIVIILFMIVLVLGGVLFYFIKIKTPAAAATTKTEQVTYSTDKIYYSDIDCDIYRISKLNHLVKFGATIIFKDADCRKLYDNLGIKDALPDDTTKKTASIGDKKAKDVIISVMNNIEYTDVQDSEKLKKEIIIGLNKAFKSDYGKEIVKDVLITDYYFN